MDTPGSSAKLVNVTAKAANRSVTQTQRRSSVIVIWFNDILIFLPPLPQFLLPEFVDFTHKCVAQSPATVTVETGRRTEVLSV